MRTRPALVLSFLLALSLFTATPHAQTTSFRTLALGTFSNGTYTYVASGTSQPVNAQNFQYLTVAVRADGGTISAGVLTIEEADYAAGQEPIYAGTWSAISTIDLTTLSTLTAESVYHFPTAGYAFVRVRISTAVTGGGKIIAVVRGS